MARSEIVFKQFPPDVVEPLMEFVKYIARLDDDYIVFMARKSYCLYKVLLNSSLRPSQKIIASDRIFELNIPLLKNKKIALIDDTLIIGTTLAEVKCELEKRYQAKVSIHVFAVDGENWVKEIVKPDKIFLIMKNHELMTFCTSIVKALYVSAMPYIVDFPISKKKKLKIEQLDIILSNVKYNSFDLTNDLQKENNVRYYTLIPEQFSDFLHDNLYEIIQILKIRLFVELSSDHLFLTIVPIVTLKSISADSLHILFSDLLKDIRCNSPISIDEISDLFSDDKSKFRLLQYLLSCKLLMIFINDNVPLIDEEFKIIFEKSETVAHFGISNYELINNLELTSSNLFKPESNYSIITGKRLPDKIISIANEFFNEINQEIDTAVDLFTKFTEIFIKFFDKREKNFREDAKKYGKRILTDNSIISKDRLKIGLPLEIIEKKLRESSSNVDISLELSLILDTCNDLGIAVPVTCDEDKIIFRAYRHGEDVKVVLELLSLIYHLINGFLISSNKSYITQISLQKIIVLFIKYGIKEKLFMPIRSVNSNDNNDKLAIEYDLKGAVPRHHFLDKNGNKTSEYFTNYLLHKNILKNDKNKIVLGDRERINEIIEANHIINNAPERASMFGDLFGKLINERISDADKPITPNDLIILASCDSILNTLKAIHKEVSIIISWINKKNFNNIKWDDNQSLKDFSRNTIRAQAYEAFNSAHLKFMGFTGNRNQKTINKVTVYLESKRDTMALQFWKSVWKGYMDVKNEDVSQFNDCITLYIKNIIECQLYIRLILFCIKYKLTNGKKITGIIKKLETELKDFIDDINEKLDEPYDYNNILEHLKRYSENKDEFPYKKTFDHYVEKLKKVCLRMETEYNNCEILIKNYGIEIKRHDYQYMIWYDIIDSTSTNVPKELVLEHSKNVSSFIDAIPPSLEKIQIAARKNGVDLYSYRGEIYSTDDGKHIFLSGQQSIFYIPAILNMLLSTAKIFRINLRLLIISTDFVLSPVYREIDKAEVEGSRFFIHLSRVKKELEKLEAIQDKENNFLMILGENLYNNILFNKNLYFDSFQQKIKIEIEQISSWYKTVCGFISIK